MRLRRLPKDFHFIASSALPEMPESARVKLATSTACARSSSAAQPP